MLYLYVINEYNRLIKNNVKKIFFAFLLCPNIFLNRLSAQTVLPLHFESLNINSGLSQGFVSSIIQDKKGLMWFGTSDGLNKYDGYSFTVYHHNPDDTSSLASDDLTGILEDSKERLWITTRHNGIDLFDRENNIFKHFRHSSKNSLRSDNIISIVEDRSGALWVRTDLGIDRVIITDIHFDDIKTQNQTLPSQPTLQVTHVNIDNILATDRSGVNIPYIFVDSKNHVLLLSSYSIWEIFFEAKNNSYKLVKRLGFQSRDPEHLPTIIEDTSNNNLYINNRNLYKLKNRSFDSITRIYRGVTPQAAWTIDKLQRLWIADSTNILQINLHTGKSAIVAPAESNYRQSLNTSIAYYTDRSGVVWIATGGYGILKYNPEIEQFHHVLPLVSIYQILENSKGDIITNSMLSLAIKKDSPFVARKFINPDSVRKYFPPIAVVSFTQDTSGNIYVAAHASLIKYDVTTKTFQKYSLPVGEQSSLPIPLFTDKRNNIWMGYNRYFVRFNSSSGKFTKFRYSFPSMPYDYDFLQCIYEENNNLWLGTINGLFRFNTINNNIKHYTYQQADTTSLSNNYIFTITNDNHEPGRYLWIGTKGGGLNRLDKLTGRFSRYDTKNGLPNNVVYGILPDESGNLWLSTNNGLSEFNKFSESFRNFDISDGLQSNEFNRYAFYKTSAGLLVFGGLNGLNYFDPKEIRPLEPPEVLITDFRLFNKKVDFKKPGSPVKKDISFIKEITLKYEQNVITFQFAAMDYRKTGNARYRYRMKGFDKNWIYSGTVHEATYTNLDAGPYEFIVQGNFGNGSWGEKQTSMFVIVVAPWYQTIWFYMILVTITITIIYAIYQYRLNQLTKLEMLRNRIARDLHDEVGSSISTIAIYSKIVHEHLGNQTFNNESLMQKITENANEIMESMNDIVWNINSKNDAFEHIITRMREHAHQLLEAKGYSLYFNFDENLLRMKLAMEKRRDFYLIYKEALNNIAKYANGKNVWITLVIHGGSIQLIIKDDGKGFDIGSVKKNSNGLTNMSFRTNALNGNIKITSAPGKGTEINLKF